MWGLNFKEQEAIKRAREGSTNKKVPVGSGVRKTKGGSQPGANCRALGQDRGSAPGPAMGDGTSLTSSFSFAKGDTILTSQVP